MKLALATGLRTFASEHGAHIVDTGIRSFFSPGGNRSDSSGGSFGAKGKFATAAIFQTVHLFGDHIGGVAQRMGEQRGLFENRRADLLKTITRENFARAGFEHLPDVDIRRGNIGHALKGLKGTGGHFLISD